METKFPGWIFLIPYIPQNDVFNFHQIVKRKLEPILVLNYNLHGRNANKYGFQLNHIHVSIHADHPSFFLSFLKEIYNLYEINYNALC